jgi:hypothetical protein
MQFEPKAVRRRAPGVIRADESYSLREFLRRIDCGDSVWRTIRRKIKLRRIGQKIFVLGADWLDYLASVGAEETDENNPSRRSRRTAEPPARTNGCRSAGGSLNGGA